VTEITLSMLNRGNFGYWDVDLPRKATGSTRLPVFFVLLFYDSHADDVVYPVQLLDDLV